MDYEKIPEVLSAWRLLAESYYSQGLYDQAVAEYRNFLARYPDEDVEGKIRLALGRTLIARFDYDKGRQELEEVVRTDPFSQSARLARYFICESYLAEYNLAPDETRNSLLQKALSDAEVLRASYPSEDSPLHLLGRIHFLMGDYERAARDLEYFCNATQGQQPPASVRLMLGEAYFNLRQYKKATGHLAQLNLNELPREEAARALYFLAESQRYDNLFQEAAATYTRLTKDFPTSPYSEVAQGRIEEVLWRMKKGI
ncbi:MAG: tetratricopeptide repeat protein [Candidatus Omnitrophica bacterium]|nr:tetratricopeptide repeat protein [Candidatus Omnitrophota bacterium]